MQRRHVIALFVVAVAGCGSDDVANPDLAQAADLSVTPPDLRVIHDLAHDLTPPPTASVSGMVLSDTGTPVMTSVLACSDVVCLYGMSDANGNFSVPGLALTHIAVKVEEDRTLTPRRAEDINPVFLTMPNQIVNVSLYVPTMGDGANYDNTLMTPQTIAVGDGLSLTFTASDVVHPLGADGDLNLAARLIPPAHVATTFDIGTDTMLAAYTLMPFATTTKNPVGLKVVFTAAQTPGAAVNFRSVDLSDGTSDAKMATGHVSQDGTYATTDQSQGITNLTWLLVSLPTG